MARHRVVALGALLAACGLVSPPRPDGGPMLPPDAGSKVDGGPETDAGGGHDGGPEADAGGLDAATQLRVSHDGGLVAGCIPITVAPRDASGAPATLAAPVDFDIACTPAVLFFPSDKCSAATQGQKLQLQGSAEQTAGLRAPVLGQYDCQGRATLAVSPPTFFVPARGRLRVERIAGGPDIVKTTCTAARVRAADADGVSTPVPSDTPVQLDSTAVLMGNVFGCTDLDAGLRVVIPAQAASAAFYLRVTEIPDGGEVSISAVPLGGALLEPGASSFPVSCRGSGVDCGGTPGACCNGCYALTNTCN